MIKIFKRNYIITIFIFIIIIGSFLSDNKSFPRLAIWNIIELTKEEDFYWKPKDAPSYFHFQPNNHQIAIFKREINPIVEDVHGDFKRAIRVAEYVDKKLGNKFDWWITKRSLRWDSPVGMLGQIEEGEIKGINSFHYSILYSTYLASIGIKSRLWVLESNDGPGGKSLTVTEIYLDEVNKWVMIDPLVGSYFLKGDDFLSVLEIRNSFFEEEDISHCSFTSDKREYSKELFKSVFLRAANDFQNKYRPEVRYGVLKRFKEMLDLLPSVYRRGLAYLLGRRDYLMHYVDQNSSSLKAEIFLARALFYFFLISIIFMTLFLIGRFTGYFFINRVKKLTHYREYKDKLFEI